MGGTDIGEFRSIPTDKTQKTTLNNRFEVNAQLNAIYLAFQFSIYSQYKVRLFNGWYKILLPFVLFGEKKKVSGKIITYLIKIDEKFNDKISKKC